MTKTIPYNTYGTVTTRASITIPASNVPYTYSPLKSDLYIASDLTDVAPKPVITNMVNYARLNIPNYQNITEIPSGHLPTDINTSTAQNWDSAFRNCRNIKSFPEPFYDMSNATNTSYMFAYCWNLTSLPNTLNTTNKLINTRNMFSGCPNITTVPNFDTSGVESMAFMFSGSDSITTVPNFDTSNVTDMYMMFDGCKALTSVPNFNTAKVTDMGWMFYWCYNIRSVPNLNTINVANMFQMFVDCRNFVNVPNFDTSNVTDMSSMFSGCRNITTIPSFNLNKVSILFGTFRECRNIRGNLYIESNNVRNATNLFYNTPNYTKNIYCHANSATYNTIYAAMGSNTYNSDWYAYLLTMENNYAEIVNIVNIRSENSVNVRFPSNKIEISYVDNNNKPGAAVVEVLPYTDYRVNFTSTSITFERYVNSLLGNYNTISLSPLTPGFESLLEGGIVSVDIKCFKDILTKTPVASENI